MHTMAALTLCGCQQQEEVVVPEPTPTPVPVPEPEPAYVMADLALALPDISTTNADAATRMASAVVQDGSARPVQILSITPFETQGVISADDNASYLDGWNSDTEYINKKGEVTDDENTRKFHYLEKLTFQRGVASILSYAKAEPISSLPLGATTKSYNGSLITKIDGEKLESDYIPRFINPSSLTFDLEPIYDVEGEGVPSHAEVIAGYLTSIANSEVTEGEETLRWKDTDGVLKGFYNGFINMGNDARPGLIAGSAANVIPFVNALYEDIDEALSSESISLMDIQKALCNQIKTNILAGTHLPTGEDGFKVVNDEVKSLGLDYPGELSLPDGAAVLVWNTDYVNSPSEQHFDVVTQTTSTSNITGMGRYAYPPELYYYGNSLIKTSNKEIEWEDIYEDNNTWDAVLSEYEYPLNPDGYATVSGDTKAVAIKDPLQYGVARLQAKVSQTAATLKDSDGDDIEVGTDKFPITGIIVSGQFPVAYDFKVLNSGISVAGDAGDESIEHFIYDRHVLDGSNVPIYLSSAAETEAFNTLVLQSKDYNGNDPGSSEITVILELLNNSQDFKGEKKMWVYKGTKFYLVGKLSFDTPPQSGDEDYTKRVFTQDHTTEVTMTINSLARAYNVMPNILSGRLEVSVEMKLKWTEATPTIVILK